MYIVLLKLIIFTEILKLNNKENKNLIKIIILIHQIQNLIHYFIIH